MAIFDPARQGQGQAPNAMFQALNQNLQAYREAQQMQREQNALSKLKSQGLLGVSSDTLINPDTGKLELTGESMTVSEHYKKLSNELGNKEMKKVFGRTATADDVKDFIKGEQAKRDQKIGEAILNRMEEVGSTNIYDIIDKDDKNFESWYNTTTKEIKKELRDVYGYTPGQKEIAFLPDFLEKAIARGDIGEGTAQALMAGATGGAIYGGFAGRDALRKRGEASYRQFLKDETGQGFRDVAGRRRKIANQQAELSKERAKLKQELKDPKLSKRNANAKLKRIKKIDAEKKKLRAEGAKAKRGKIGDLKSESAKAREAFTSARNKGTLAKARGIGGGLASSIGGSKLGGALGEAFGGETGRGIGSVVGAVSPELIRYGAPQLLKFLGRQGVTKPTNPYTVGLGALAYGAGSALDYLLND